MLAESTLPTARYDVPIAPRIMTPRAPYVETTPGIVPIVTPPIVSSQIHTRPIVAEPIVSREPEAGRSETYERSSFLRTEPRAEVVEHRLYEPVPPPPMPAPAEQHRQELVPVPRSVFDDDFFRSAAPRRPEARRSPSLRSKRPTPACPPRVGSIRPTRLVPCACSSGIAAHL